MKKYTVLFLAVMIAVSLCACHLSEVLEPAPTDAAATEVQTTEAPEKATDPVPVIGALGDYVRTAEENEIRFDNGKTNTLRLPEIMLDSADAIAANIELDDRFGEVVRGNANSTGAYALDYEAYLNGRVLSVVVIARYDGGNSYGLCYNLDVVTGGRLDSADVCESKDMSYDDCLAAFLTNLTAYYEETWGMIPGNDTERERTLSDDNLRAAVFYLDGDGKLMALTDIYAAVGGGHWVAEIAAE